MMRLYDYYRSSAAYRCRIALGLKDLTWEHVPIHLLRDGGEQRQERYRKVNPQGLIPALALDDGPVLTQSLAIIEYLEERHPQPPLLPSLPEHRAKVRAFALAIACDIHPLNNLRVLKYLKQVMDQPQSAIDRWYCHWVETGLKACQGLLAEVEGSARFCFGMTPGLADVCLIPQLFNARRFNCDLGGLERLLDIEANCLELPAFADAMPERQPDAPGDT